MGATLDGAEKVEFTYVCVDCRKRNKTSTPAEDNMLHCSRCGFPTVQVCQQVSRKVGRTTTTWKP